VASSTQAAQREALTISYFDIDDFVFRNYIRCMPSRHKSRTSRATSKIALVRTLQMLRLKDPRSYKRVVRAAAAFVGTIKRATRADVELARDIFGSSRQSKRRGKR